jgi:hypothetical protein
VEKDVRVKKPKVFPGCIVESQFERTFDSARKSVPSKR